MPYCVSLYKGNTVEDEMCFLIFENAFEQVTNYMVKEDGMTYTDAVNILKESKKLAEESLVTNLNNNEFRAWSIEDDNTDTQTVFCTIKYMK
jgi:hypothetical protein